MYCHATSKDAAKADPIGDARAEKLARAAKAAGVEHIVYNSSGRLRIANQNRQSGEENDLRGNGLNKD
jgi:hypothetical protein